MDSLRKIDRSVTILPVYDEETLQAVIEASKGVVVMGKFEGKTAIVTGASRGIGREIALLAC